MLKRLPSAAVILATAQTLVALVMLLLPNQEGSLGGVLFALIYAAPLLLLALALRSAQAGLRTVAGWAALGLAMVYSAIVVGNWSGYSALQAATAVAVSAPTVALDLVVFWSVVARHWVTRPPAAAQ